MQLPFCLLSHLDPVPVPIITSKPTLIFAPNLIRGSFFFSLPLLSASRVVFNTRIVLANSLFQYLLNIKSNFLFSFTFRGNSRSSSVLYLVFLRYVFSLSDHYLVQQDVDFSPITSEVDFFFWHMWLVGFPVCMT